MRKRASLSRTFSLIDGDIYVCGFSEKASQELSDSGNTVSIDQKSCDRLQNIAVHVASTLKDANVEVKQACYLPQSNDGVPLIGLLFRVTVVGSF